ncbi:hypothetical protein [Hymenobacter fodinae]|uniref:DUF4760 domain-containing protein n=1 Tax=Hymenobacter fodinae TaxID=2510796 RepID=A0A4Z0P1Y6_9BACT|nr:hypothetical protein [Hymenobacter fodinae]TGE04770.1 hypothetical protein EU556_21555 [Hymenobacter fodinae]
MAKAEDLNSNDGQHPQTGAEPRVASLYDYFEITLKTISAVVPALVFLFGIIQYRAQKEVEARQAEKDFRRTIYEKQFDYYTALSDTISRLMVIIMRPQRAVELFNSRDYIRTKENFFHMYYGKINLIESPEVERAIIRFRYNLEKYQQGDDIPESKLRQMGLAVSAECSKSLQKTWGLDSTQFKAKIIK